MKQTNYISWFCNDHFLFIEVVPDKFEVYESSLTGNFEMVYQEELSEMDFSDDPEVYDHQMNDFANEKMMECFDAIHENGEIIKNHSFAEIYKGNGEICKEDDSGLLECFYPFETKWNLL